MTPEAYLIAIKEKLDEWQIKIMNRKGENDYYELTENLLIKLLNPILDCNLENTNRDSARFPGIDLIDYSKKIGIQVTADDSLAKIKHTLNQIQDKHLNTISTLYIFHLKGNRKQYRQKSLTKFLNTDLVFNINKHVIDIAFICERLKYLSSDPVDLKLIYDHVCKLVGTRQERVASNVGAKVDLARLNLENFIDETYGNKDFLHRQIDQVSDTLTNYSVFFSYIAKIHKKKALIGNEKNIFLFLIESIFASKSNRPLVVCGIQGSGKSSFLHVLYKALCLYSKGEVPVYIDIQKYFTDADDIDLIGKRMNEDLTGIQRLLERINHTEIILIIDGADDSFSTNRELSRKLFNQVLGRFSDQKKIIGLNIKDQVFKVQDKALFEREGEIEVILNNISVYDRNFKSFIDLYSKTKFSSEDEIDPAELSFHLIDQIKKFKIHRVDLFTLDLLAEKIDVADFTRDCNSLSNFLSKYCDSKIDSDDIRSVANHAFDFYINKKKLPEGNKMNGRQLLFTHPSIRDFLLAKVIIERLNDEKIDKQELEFVYTDNINSFCKEIMNESPQMQRNVFKAISRLFGDVGFKAKAHFCYLLGRFVDLKDEAKTFLKNILLQEELQITNATNGLEPLESENEFKDKLLYYRSLYISLIYLSKYGQPDFDKANRGYLSILMKNELWDSVNRGFHIEYYGDLPFDPEIGPLQKEDDVSVDFANTYTKLYNKVWDALHKAEGYSLIAVDIYTLCSLAQHRQINPDGYRDPEKRKNIITLCSKILKSKLRISLITEYIGLVMQTLDYGDSYSFGSFLSEMRQLKQHSRAGWVDRGIKNPETVAAHMYNMLLLGYICLPEISREYGYDKNKILRMVLIHDLGEAPDGDKSRSKKTQEDYEKERRAIKKYSFLNTYMHNGISEISDLYNAFENKNDEDINTRIARDLDRLDNLQQLYHYYYVEQHQIEDFAKWEEGLVQEIETIEGQKILDYISQAKKGSRADALIT